MEIYVLRHGIAENGYGMPDGQRALTAEGREKLRAVLQIAKAAGAAPAAILTSPLRRAIETGNIAAEVLGYRGDFVRTDALEPESSPAAAWKEIAARRNQQNLLLVGHEPLLSQLVAHLLGAPPVQVWMRPATFVAVDLSDFSRSPRALLKYMLPAI